MAYVRVRGVRFHVVDLGRDTGRVPVVMLHGLFTGSAASWFFTVAPALARDRRVRLPDWRGHGLTERTTTGYDTATMADDLAALTADLPPFAIAGHSYGATVAVRFARAHPGRTTALALVDPPFADIDVRRYAVPGVARRGAVAELLKRTSLASDLAAEPPVTAAELAELAGLPVLAVVGTDSPFRSAADLVGRALPAARRHVLSGGHDLHITARARLTPLLGAFLEEAHA
ncbi:alpha/beta fold hydrolase [Actinomadura rupiterrae]|uniref:alpha/beta fold hydrolase n=1 Tax=Actinomadura rupiterrae TaxID=559627 RepID=UPI0020A2879C|nr:alpha/beta fold hydrolase [Actinomadura rupiterrae]MCP2335775.1 pimeloyl-ACP methyl ester carboxylesterase [Actinomadura rupiterrae]